MASGKSVIGNALSKLLKFDYVDLDAKIENDLGQSISEIFKTKGEIFFRRKEAELLKSLVNSKENLIISTGGGTVCYGNTMQVLSDTESVSTIYLKAEIITLTNRLFVEKDKRPLISHINSKENLEDFIRKHLFERSFYYNQAKYKIDVNNSSVEEIATEITSKLI